MSPIVSIIIPVYNTERYLRKCLDSVVNQTFKDIEIICVNDGSSDNSSSILLEYAGQDNRIVVINQCNQGVSAARNAGISIARGKYIGFVDSDDWIEADTYAAAVKHMANDVDLVCWGVNVEGDAEARKKMLKIFSSNLSGKILADVSKKFALSTTIWDKLFKKVIIKDYDIHFPQNIRYEDTCFLWQYMLHVNNFYCIGQKYYNYILHPESFMTSRYTEKNHKHLADRLYGFYEVYLHYDKFGAAADFKVFFARHFYRYFRKIYLKMPAENKKNWLEEAAGLADKMNVGGSKYRRQLVFLRSGQFGKLNVVISDQSLLIKRLWLYIKSWL